MGNTNANAKQANVKNTNAELKGQAKNQINDETDKKRVHIDVNNPDLQDKLTQLNWYLGIANPVFVPVKKNVNVFQNGKQISKEIEKREFDHYSFNAVKGVKLEDWIKNTFGDEYQLDPKTKEVYKLVSKDETQNQEVNNDPDEDEASVNVVEPSK